MNEGEECLRRQIREIVKKFEKQEGRRPTAGEVSKGLAEQYDVQRADSTIRGYLRLLGLAHASHINTNTEDDRKWATECQRLIDLIAPNLNRPLRLTGDWIITSDWHNPAMFFPWVMEMLRQAERWRQRKLIIGGDLFDFTMLSPFWEKRPDAKVARTEDELALGNEVLDRLEKQFTTIVWLLGNHEKNRLFRCLKDSVGGATLLDIVGRTKPSSKKKWQVSNLSFCYLDGIRITHPHAYSQVKLSVARRLSEIHRCSVLQAHGHFLSLGYSPSGYIIGDTGGMMDRDRMGYIYNNGETCHPVWNNGFMIYKDKKLIPYGEGIGDI